MAKRSWVVFGIVAVVLLAILRYFAGGHQTPSGQPSLTEITSQSLPQFMQEFDSSTNTERVLLLLSPTCPVCQAGSSKVNAVLERHPNSNIRVFAVWEPILPTDWGRPTTHVLARLSDVRVTQFWDKKHLIADLVQKGANGQRPACCYWNGIWWDVIAAYPPAAKGTSSLPAPELLNGTVVRTAPQLEAKLTQR